jgi:hypothetical protein
MCDICDGMTHEEFNQRTMRKIEQYGWVISGVEDGPGLGWAYTVGLLEGFDHPELVVVGLDWPEAVHLLNQLGDRVAAGRLLYPGLGDDTIAGIDFGAVAPSQWKARSTFAGWQGYYEWRGGAPPDAFAVQVFVSGAPATRLVELGDPDSDISLTRSVNPPPRRSPPPR